MIGHDVSRFLWRYKGVYALLGTIILLSAFLESLGVGALFPLMSALLGQDTEKGGGTLLELMEAAADALPFNNPVVSSACLLFGIVSIKALVLLLRESVTVSASATVVKRVKQEMFAALLLAPYTYFVDRSQENLNYRLTRAPEHLGLLLFLIPSALAQALIIVAIVTLLATISWEVIAAIVIAGAALYGLLRQVAKRVSHMAGRRRAAASAKELSAAQEFLSGIKEIVVAQAGRRWERLYTRCGEEIRRVEIKDGIWQAVPGVLIEWMFFAVVIGSMVAIAGSRGTQALAEAVPMMTVYLYAVYRLIRAVSLMSAYKLRIASQLADAELLSRTLGDLTTNIPTTTVSRGEPLRFTNVIAFANVSLRYPEREECALENVTLSIPRGRLSAFVGQSGAGKTTLVNLLLGLYRPTTGSITVDGVDLTSYDRSDWLPLVGYVSQEAFIINGTILENVVFGLTDCPRSEVEAAAKTAYAHDFILELPQGYETEVGERGFMLSGGQRQRVAIARALLRKPEILIFDEATSQLDNVSESLIQKAIDDVSRTHTVIVVAHRLSMVKRADQIVVLDRGRVVECGRHEDLIARKGQYSLMLAGS